MEQVAGNPSTYLTFHGDGKVTRAIAIRKYPDGYIVWAEPSGSHWYGKGEWSKFTQIPVLRKWKGQ